jgi:membrane protein
MTFGERIREAALFLRRLQREIGYDDCMGMAAQIAFYLLLAIFPFLLFLLSLISFLPIPNLEPQVLSALEESLPPEAYNLVSETVVSLLSKQRGELLGVGLLIALWSASMGIGALITTINRAYNIHPRRSLAQQKGLAILLTLAVSGIMLLSTVIILFGPRVSHAIFQTLGLAGDSYNFWTRLRQPLVFALNLLTLSIFYYYGPEARQQFRWIMPGAVVATGLWLGASSLFRLFVRNFGSYEITYGSIAAVIILLIYLWISGLIFLLGAEINSLMKRLDRHEIEVPRGRAAPVREEAAPVREGNGREAASKQGRA